MAKNKIIKKDELSGIDKIISGMEKPNPPEVNSEWDKFEELIDNQPIEQKLTSGNRILALYIAASILILLLTGFVINQKGISHYSSDRIVEVILKDGSVIKLNHSSKISYKYTYGWFNRNIKLDGEAYFDVKKNGSTFRVITNESEVKVTGTSFNVKSENYKTEVGVTKGKVEFKSLSYNKTKIVLTPGLYSSCTKGEKPEKASKLKNNEIASWLNMRLTYHNEKVEKIIKDIEDAFSISILVLDKEILKLEISGIVEGKTAEEIIQTLCLTINKKYRIKEGKYEIY